jgi:predicted ArsR family transcriptional regulator
MADRLPAGVADPDRPYVALGVRSRRRLLEVLRAAGAPLGAAQLAEAVGLHVTTVRAHLRVLEAAGLVVPTDRPSSGPGRPGRFYAPASGIGSADAHGELAEMLAGALGAGGAQGRRRAEQAGRRWAAREMPDAERLPWDQAVGVVEELFGRVGFAPRRLGAEGYRLALEHCPFRDVARVHPEVVCTLHLGLLRGALSRLGQSEVAGSAQLQPFVAPELCMVEIPAPRTTGATAGRPTLGAVG